MTKSRDFLEVVNNNSPPCLPDDKLYWFDDKTGEIMTRMVILRERWEL